MTTELVLITGSDPAIADWQTCAAAWLERKRARSGSERTAMIYERALQTFFASCRKPPADVLPQDVLSYATGPNGKNGKPVTQTTINHRIAVVSSFYGFATRYLVVRDGVARPLAVFNPAAALDRATVQAYAQSRAGQLEDIRAQIRRIPGDVAGSRDRALILCYLLTGRRLQEIATLRWGDLEVSGSGGQAEQAVLRIGRVKGGEVLTIALPKEAWAALRAYLQADGRWGRLASADPLFVALRGDGRRALTAKSVWVIIRERLGLHPHQLRHTFARQMWELGADVRQIQALLGHKNLATTEIYLGRLEVKSNPFAERLAAAFLAE